MSKHIQYLDNLRTAAIILAVLCTALNGFMVYPDAHSFVPAATSYPGVDIFINASVPLILAVLFFISGFLNASTLRIHVVSGFIRKKWIRLGLPWLAGCIIVAPELAYISHVSTGGTDTVPAFYQAAYWHTAFTQGQYWFLAFLLILCLLLGLAKTLRHTCLQHTKTTGPLSPVTAGIFFAMLSAMLAGAQHLGGNHWFNAAYVLTFRLDYAVIAVFYFAAGTYAEKHRWFSARGYMPTLPWFYAFVITCIVYGGISIMPFANTFSATPALTALITFTGVPGLLSAFAAWGKQPGHRAAMLANLSYPFYFVSEPFAQNTAFFLNPLAVAAGIKILLILAITIIYGYLVSKYALIHFRSFKR